MYFDEVSVFPLQYTEKQNSSILYLFLEILIFIINCNIL